MEDVDLGIREGLATRWSFMGPFETIDLNAPGGVRDYVERYQSIYERLFPQMQRRVDWAGPVLDVRSRGERRRRMPQEAHAATAALARPPADGAGRAQAPDAVEDMSE